MKPKMPAIKPITIPRNILIARIHFSSAFNSSPVLPPCLRRRLASYQSWLSSFGESPSFGMFPFRGQLQAPPHSPPTLPKRRRVIQKAATATIASVVQVCQFPSM